MFTRTLLTAVALSLSAATIAHAQGTVQTHRWSGRTCKIYVPTTAAPSGGRPLVVMLHGCTQDPDQFATGTAINRLAEQRGWLVLYPEQPSSENPNKCWNWFEAAHQARGRGEPAVIAGVVNQAKRAYPVDGDRVYVAGLSAGAGMSVIMAAAYPDVFAAAGVASGVEFGAARDMISAFSAMRSGGPSPTAQGQAAYRAMGSRARPVPVIVFHGDADTTVAPVNADQVVAQWVRTNDLATDGAPDGDVPTRPSSTRQATATGGLRYTVADHRDAGGRVVIRDVRVAGMGHAWSGGDPRGSYVDPAGPDASAMLLTFFAQHTRAGAAPPTPTPTPTPITPTLPAPTTPITPTLPAPAPGTTIALRSEGARDGWVGRYRAWGLSSGRPKLGDPGMFNADLFRAVLSFDLSHLPAGAVVDRVVLRIRRASLAGDKITAVRVDVVDGALGESAALAPDDFGAQATHVDVARLRVPARDGEASEVTLPARVLGLIQARGQLQVRLSAVSTARFQKDELVLFGGEDGALAPELVVKIR